MHLFVVWQRWADPHREERSEFILDAYAEAQGEVKALEASVAMGLTPREAGELKRKVD